MTKSRGRFSPTHTIKAWPLPTLPELGREGFIARNGKRLLWVAGGAAAVGSCWIIPPLPPYPFGGRVAFVAFAAKKAWKSPPMSARVTEKGFDLKKWRDLMKSIPDPGEVDVRNHNDFADVVAQFRAGKLVPLSQVTLHGEFGQKIANTFAEGYKLAESRLRARRERVLLYALTTAREGIAKVGPADETVIDDKSIVELTLKISEDDSLLELGDHAYYTKPSAHLVLECLMNGVHVLHNVDDRVVLRWGDWVESDFA